jgi:NitT/TauT family transport system substrate-binding protein
VSSPASDETLFGNVDWIKANEKEVDIIVAEFAKLWAEMNKDPSIVERERVKRNLMADQPKEVLSKITSFYTTSTKEGIYAPAGGGADVARSDFEFYVEAGQMQGPAASLKVEDFWYLGPLERARKAMGQ